MWRCDSDVANNIVSLVFQNLIEGVGVDVIIFYEPDTTLTIGIVEISFEVKHFPSCLNRTHLLILILKSI